MPVVVRDDELGTAERRTAPAEGTGALLARFPLLRDLVRRAVHEVVSNVRVELG